MNVKEKILTGLRRIEKKYNVKIIYACESGSRAWGFPSEDSDYDVRFIYVHPKDWYLSIVEKRDVIEIPVDNELDINGWDIRKSLSLLRKSNAPILEWLSSPIVYMKDVKILAPLRTLSGKAFLPESVCHHYLSMAKKMLEKIENSSKVRIKTYLYAIRPVLCCMWIIEKGTQPPMLFGTLKKLYLPKGKSREEVDKLLIQKAKSLESDLIDHSIVLDEFLSVETQKITDNIPKNPLKCDVNNFDSVFKEILESA